MSHPSQDWPAPTSPSVAGGAPPGPPVAESSSPGSPTGGGITREPQVVRTDTGATDGLAKCPRCGATQIALNLSSGNLRCGFCRFEFTAVNALERYGLDGPPRDLVGTVVGSGSQDIIPSAEQVLTFKCSACGAEIVIDTQSSTQARCHWCRNTLSMNQQVPNGAVPDMILPFALSKESAVQHIQEFVGRRMRFAHPRFKAEFNAENVLGVYLPYMVVDVNAKVALHGEGEHQTRSYTVKEGEKEVRYYDADLYRVTRDFDLYIDDLTVESSAERLDQNVLRNTNNIINAIMPFDVQNSVVYDSNYLTGFTSEKRDTDLGDLQPLARSQSQDVARYHANETVQFYDRGVRWDDERIDIVGQRWVSAYLPVWLYSFYERRPDGSGLTHYVAVNGRSGETVGSVPVNQKKLLTVSAAIEAVALIVMIILMVVI